MSHSNFEFYEYQQLQILLSKLGQQGARVRTLASVQSNTKANTQTFEIQAVELGSENLQDPCLLFVGGVHGLERIGTQVILSYLETITESMHWDPEFLQGLKNMRLCFIPLLNPVGMYNETRSNGGGVDLMRNAPVEADGKAGFLFGGHRISSKLPWYRGEKNEPMQTESEALCHYVSKNLFPAKFSLVLDVHSGFGVKDRLWFPYAKSKTIFKKIAEIFYLKKMLDKTYPYHVYEMEPQSAQYTTHGDLWDYLLLLHEKEAEDSTFLPLTLEIGSWIWLKKNPLQALSRIGFFHPMKQHRIHRTLRRHLLLFDFLKRMILNSNDWSKNSQKHRLNYTQNAKELWYE